MAPPNPKKNRHPSGFWMFGPLPILLLSPNPQKKRPPPPIPRVSFFFFSRMRGPLPRCIEAEQPARPEASGQLSFSSSCGADPSYFFDWGFGAVPFDWVLRRCWRGRALGGNVHLVGVHLLKSSFYWSLSVLLKKKKNSLLEICSFSSRGLNQMEVCLGFPAVPFLTPCLGLLKYTAEKKLAPNYSNLSTGGPS